MCAGVAAASFVLWQLNKTVSALMWAFIISIVLANIVRLPARFSPGVVFSSGSLLRASVAALGLTVPADAWLKAGPAVVNVLIVVAAIFALGLWVGVKAGLTKSLATLIGVGTGICGASAIAATGPAIKARDEEMGLAVACITLFGLAAMFTYPFLYAGTMVGGWLGNKEAVYAIWVGTGIHETAQVAAAAGQVSGNALGIALLVKAIRIFMIGPMVLIATYLYGEAGEGGRKAVVPLFAVVFLLNTFLALFFNWGAEAGLPFPFFKDWSSVRSVLSGYMVPFLLATSLAGVGLKVKVSALAKMGRKAFTIGATVAVAAGILALVLAILIAPYV